MRVYESSPGHPIELAEPDRGLLPATGQLVQAMDGPRRVLAVTTITVAAPGVEQVDHITLSGIVDPW